MNEEKLIGLIKENLTRINDKEYLLCKDAFEIAKQNNINLSLIGKACNENQIKIKGCQLGCF